MKQTRALAFISAVVLLAGSAAAPVAAADSVESLKTVSTSDNLGGVAQVSPRITAGSLIRDISTGLIPKARW